MYKQRSGTVWRVGRYEIMVKASSFLHLRHMELECGHAAFDWACSLRLIDGQLCLQFQSGRALLLGDEDITVRRLRADSVGVQRALADADFERLDMRISDFNGVPDLFQRLSAGVSDTGADEVAVDLVIDMNGDIVGPVRGYFQPSECKVTVYRRSFRVARGCEVTLSHGRTSEKFAVSWSCLNTGVAGVEPHVVIWLS